MARVYLFNPQTSNQRGGALQVTVNSAAPTYRIPYTYKVPNAYTPNSTSGNRVPGQPTGNDFGDHNDLAVGGVDGSLLYHLDISEWPGEDLIAYLFDLSIALISSGGTFLEMLDTTGSGPGLGADEDEPAAATPHFQTSPGNGAGSVYIFNLFSDDTTVSLNGGSIGTIKAWNPSGAQPYTPNSAVAARVTNENENFGAIWTGLNKIALHDSISGDRAFDLTPPRQTNQDLILYLLSDQWLLLPLPAGELRSGPIQRSSPGGRASN